MLFVFYQLISCADRIQRFKNASTLIKFHFDKQKAIKAVDQPDEQCLELCNQYKSELHIPSSYSGCEDVCADTTVTSCLYSSCIGGDHSGTEDETLACANSCLNSQSKPDQKCIELCKEYKSKLDIPSSYSGCEDVCTDTTFTDCLFGKCIRDNSELNAETLTCANNCFKDDDKGLSTGAIIGIVIGVIVVVAVVVVVVVIVIRKKKASNKSSDEENRQESL